MHTIADRKLLMLRPDEIIPNPNRIRRSFSEHELRQLADSIATTGIVQPISIRRNYNGNYELISGERRLRAARIAGLRRIPCVLHRVDDITASFYSVVENLQRSNLNIFEEAESIHALISRYNITQTETAIRLGIAQSTLCNKLRLLQLSPNLQERILYAGLTERHARALLRLPINKRSEFLDVIIAEGLTLKQTEEAIKRILQPDPEPEEVPPPPKETEPKRKISIGDVRIFANSLSKLVDTMQSAGIDARSKKTETDKYIEYKVRISKGSLQNGCQQLKIC